MKKLAYIAFDFDTEMKEAGKSSNKEKGDLTDGNIITVVSERFRSIHHGDQGHGPIVRQYPL